MEALMEFPKRNPPAVNGDHLWTANVRPPSSDNSISIWLWEATTAHSSVGDISVVSVNQDSLVQGMAIWFKLSQSDTSLGV